MRTFRSFGAALARVAVFAALVGCGGGGGGGGGGGEPTPTVTEVDLGLVASTAATPTTVTLANPFDGPATVTLLDMAGPVAPAAGAMPAPVGVGSIGPPALPLGPARAPGPGGGSGAWRSSSFSWPPGLSMTTCLTAPGCPGPRGGASEPASRQKATRRSRRRPRWGSRGSAALARGPPLALR